MLATHSLLFSDSEVKFHFLRHALRNQLDDDQKFILYFSECCLSVVCSGDGYVHKTWNAGLCGGQKRVLDPGSWSQRCL